MERKMTRKKRLLVTTRHFVVWRGLFFLVIFPSIFYSCNEDCGRVVKSSEWKSVKFSVKYDVYNRSFISYRFCPVRCDWTCSVTKETGNCFWRNNTKSMRMTTLHSHKWNKPNTQKKRTKEVYTKPATEPGAGKETVCK